MKVEKFKVLLYLKKSGMDKNGKAPIMGRITVNRTMAHSLIRKTLRISAIKSVDAQSCLSALLPALHR